MAFRPRDFKSLASNQFRHPGDGWRNDNPILHRRIAAVPREEDATKAEEPGARNACAAQTGLLPHNPVTSELRRAGNGTRTRDPNLGKVVLYQLSYSRIGREVTRSDGVLQAS